MRMKPDRAKFECFQDRESAERGVIRSIIVSKRFQDRGSAKHGTIRGYHIYNKEQERK